MVSEDQKTDMKEGKKSVIFKDIRRYYCKFCGICRSKKSLLRSHILSEHEEEMVEEEIDDLEEEQRRRSLNICDECDASFTKPAYLKQHMQSHSIERPFSCPLDDCHQSYRRKDHLTRHLLTHQGKLFTCPVENCNLKFAFQANAKRHVKQQHGEKDFKFSGVNQKMHVCLTNAKPDVKERHDEKDPLCNGENQKKHVCEINATHNVKDQHCEEDPLCHCKNQKNFVFQTNANNDMNEQHDEEELLFTNGNQKLVCQEVGCGKEFKYASRLRKHEESHVKLDYVEAICCEPGCMKHFTNIDCLKAHLRSSHQYITCVLCGTQQLKKNIKHHLRTHERQVSTKRIKCSFAGCLHTFSSRSNLQQHIKAVHLELRPFACRVTGCGKKFPFKHVRDNHEKTGFHVFMRGDFVESDEQFRSRPRGGRKRKPVTVETLLRKRVVPMDQSSALDNGTEYLRWLLSDDQE